MNQPTATNELRADDSSPVLRRGPQTTEFWLVVIANLAIALAGVFEAIDAQWAVLAAAVLTAIYTATRGAVKFMAAKYRQGDDPLPVIDPQQTTIPPTKN